MSKLKLSLCAAALMVVTGHAMAAGEVTNGTVEFNGKLISETCSIVPADVDKQVTLPTLSVLSLASAGTVAGTTDFSLSVEECGDVKNVAAHFEAIGSTGSDGATGNLTNTITDDTGAGNVQVRLFDAGTSAHIPVGGTGAFFPIEDDNTATMHYVGGYYATGATTSGLVNAKVSYTLAYK
ncbi:F17 fimbrial protein [Serratia sp. S1B]|nr:F17 fimbrial protein [Serratia sp. S1B]